MCFEYSLWGDSYEITYILGFNRVSRKNSDKQMISLKPCLLLNTYPCIVEASIPKTGVVENACIELCMKNIKTIETPYIRWTQTFTTE